MFDELFFWYDKLDIKNITLLEDFIYKYVFIYKNNNSIDKMILFYNSKNEILLNDELLKKLDNPKIFYVSEMINNKNFFHITHNKIINNHDYVLFDNIINTFNNFSLKNYKDKFCDYSRSFLIEFK